MRCCCRMRGPTGGRSRRSMTATSGAIAGYFMRRTRDAELTADLTAEVFAAAFAAAERYRPDAKTAAPWLFTIAQNTLVSSVRRGRVEEAARRELGVRAAVELRRRERRPA